MRRYLPWAGLALALAAVVAGALAYWHFQVRYRPKTIDERQGEIARILQESGWVSPGAGGPALYMVSFRSCPDCIRFKSEVFPALHEAGVDTRVIMIARADKNALARSTPAERATVAELWLNRSWPLLERWYKTPIEAWTAPGVPPADGDLARGAVVEAGRQTVDRLVPLLKANGVDFAYPLLIWWDAEGRMRGCACEKRQTYEAVRQELLAAAAAQPPAEP